MICQYERQLAGLFIAAESQQHADVPCPLGVLLSPDQPELYAVLTRLEQNWLRVVSRQTTHSGLTQDLFSQACQRGIRARSRHAIRLFLSSAHSRRRVAGGRMKCPLR